MNQHQEQFLPSNLALEHCRAWTTTSATMIFYEVYFLVELRTGFALLLLPSIAVINLSYY